MTRQQACDRRHRRPLAAAFHAERELARSLPLVVQLSSERALARAHVTAVDDMVKTYGHSADERRLDDIDAHFAAKRDADRDAIGSQARF
jgi:hypothetical protein